MSAFDDEFGLFGDDTPPEEEERKPTLGARKIASNEANLDDIEPEDDNRPARRRMGGTGGSSAVYGGDRPPRGDGERWVPRGDRGPRSSGDPVAAQARAVELLRFLASRLVSRPDDVIVELVDGSRGPLIELEVHPDDFGKVIGKGGRVAQALRVLVRATAEGKVSVDIVDVGDGPRGADHSHARDDGTAHDDEHDAGDAAGEPAALAAAIGHDEGDDDDGIEALHDAGDDEPATPPAPGRAKRTATAKKAPAKLATAKKTPAKKAAAKKTAAKVPAAKKAAAKKSGAKKSAGSTAKRKR